MWGEMVGAGVWSVAFLWSDLVGMRLHEGQPGFVIDSHFRRSGSVCGGGGI